MKTIRIKIYKFAELSKEAQQKAISELYDINVSYGWWESLYNDAEQIGLKLEYFDLDRNRYATGKLLEDTFQVATNIVKNHGDTCQTNKTARQYLTDYGVLFQKYEDANKRGYVAEEKETDYDNELQELENDFLKSLLEDYSILLQQESEYLQSEAAIIETIEANDYDFTKDGKLF